MKPVWTGSHCVPKPPRRRTEPSTGSETTSQPAGAPAVCGSVCHAAIGWYCAGLCVGLLHMRVDEVPMSAAHPLKYGMQLRCGGRRTGLRVGTCQDCCIGSGWQVTLLEVQPAGLAVEQRRFVPAAVHCFQSNSEIRSQDLQHWHSLLFETAGTSLTSKRVQLSTSSSRFLNQRNWLSAIPRPAGITHAYAFAGLP